MQKWCTDLNEASFRFCFCERLNANLKKDNENLKKELQTLQRKLEEFQRDLQQNFIGIHSVLDNLIESSDATKTGLGTSKALQLPRDKPINQRRPNLHRTVTMAKSKASPESVQPEKQLKRAARLRLTLPTSS